MSAGNPIIKLRVTKEMKAEIESAIASANHYTREEPYDMSAWIRKAIADKLDHLRRSSRKANRKNHLVAG